MQGSFMRQENEFTCSLHESCDIRDESCAKDPRWNDKSSEWTHLLPFVKLVICVTNHVSKDPRWNDKSKWMNPFVTFRETCDTAWRIDVPTIRRWNDESKWMNQCVTVSWNLWHEWRVMCLGSEVKFSEVKELNPWLLPFVNLLICVTNHVLRIRGQMISQVNEPICYLSWNLWYCVTNRCAKDPEVKWCVKWMNPIVTFRETCDDAC